MSKIHKILAALLVAQLALAGGLLAWSLREPKAFALANVLSFDQGAADRIVIEGPEKARAELVRKGGRWVVATAGNFPGDSAKVAQLLGSLAALKSAAPIATSAEAAERFKVADAGFERHITVEGDGKRLADLLLGSAQGAHLTYARRSGDSTVLGVDLMTQNIPVGSDDWLDRGALRIPREDIATIEVAGLTLVPVQGTVPTATSAAQAKPRGNAAPAPSWEAQGLAPNRHLDAQAAVKLAEAIAELRFRSRIELDEDARHTLGAPVVTLAVKKRSGERVNFEFFKQARSDDVTLTASSQAGAFVLSGLQARPLVQTASRKALLAISK